MTDDELIFQTLACVFEVHTILGPGLVESAYHACLRHELTLRNLNYESELRLPVVYKGLEVDQYYRLDLVIEKRLVLELKSVEFLLPVHKAQLITYLKVGKYPLGLLLNFNVPKMKEGIMRVYPYAKPT